MVEIQILLLLFRFPESRSLREEAGTLKDYLDARGRLHQEVEERERGGFHLHVHPLEHLAET